MHWKAHPLRCDWSSFRPSPPFLPSSFSFSLLATLFLPEGKNLLRREVYDADANKGEVFEEDEDEAPDEEDEAADIQEPDGVQEALVDPDNEPFLEGEDVEDERALEELMRLEALEYGAS